MVKRIDPKRTDRVDRGQVIVLFALMLTALIGFTGIAIDLAHARGLAQDMQRAADAGALAGVVYLPSSANSATTNAAAESTANQFTDNCTIPGTCGDVGSVRITYGVNSAQRQLTVTIKKWMPTSFLGVLGIRTIAVTRSATATYADPIALGAPDHVLGFAPFPTRAVQLCAGTHTIQGRSGNCQSYHPYGQGFYLELRGPWTGVEHGDAFSPYFEDFTPPEHAQTFGGATVPGGISRCTASVGNPPIPAPSYNNECDTGSGAKYDIVPNPMYNQQNSSDAKYQGYNFIFAFPPNMKMPALIKLFDPLDECSHPGNGKQGPATNPVKAPDGPSTQGGADASQQVSTTAIDQCNPTMFSTQIPTTLQFTVYPPADQLAEVASAANNYPTGANNGLTGPGFSTSPGDTTDLPAGDWALTNGGNGQKLGADSLVVTGTTASRAFQWYTYAEFQNNTNKTQYVMLNVNSVIDANGQGGTGGNDFALESARSMRAVTMLVRSSRPVHGWRLRPMAPSHLCPRARHRVTTRVVRIPT